MGLYYLLAALLLAHLLAAATMTVVVRDYPFIGRGYKFMGIVLSWLLPFAGVMIAGRMVKLAPASGKWTHGEHMGATGIDDDPRLYEGHMQSNDHHDGGGHYGDHGGSDSSGDGHGY